MLCVCSTTCIYFMPCTCSSTCIYFMLCPCSTINICPMTYISFTTGLSFKLVLPFRAYPSFHLICHFPRHTLSIGPLCPKIYPRSSLLHDPGISRPCHLPTSARGQSLYLCLEQFLHIYPVQPLRFRSEQLLRPRRAGLDLLKSGIPFARGVSRSKRPGTPYPTGSKVLTSRMIARL